MRGPRRPARPTARILPAGDSRAVQKADGSYTLTIDLGGEAAREQAGADLERLLREALTTPVTDEDLR